jgi:ATP-dependent exoDNAse (exonuclease V) beta subunit
MKQAEHPSGEIITFTEEDHKYVDSKGQVYTSVTSLIHNHFPVFDTDGVAKKYAAKRGLNPEDVKRDWKENADKASEYGTRVHLFAEALLVGHTPPEPSDEQDEKSFKVVREFIEKEFMSKYTFIASEKIIFSPKYKISGTIDLLAKDRQGNLFVLDWKTNKEIKFGSSYGSGLGFLSHLDDCNFSHYSIQLNMYRRLLHEEGYFRGALSASMALLFVRRLPQPALQVYPIKRMDDEIDKMLAGCL